jgi:hypothetical protein
LKTENTTTEFLSGRVAAVGAALLLAVGVVAWLALNLEVTRTLQWGIAIPAVIGLCAMALLSGAPARQFVGKRLERLRNPDAKTRAMTAILIGVLSGAYLALTAYVHARDLFPRIHDEFSYLLGAQMLARGRLWMSQHPLADFFESFHILVKPVYASIYFPGTALLHVPGVWLGLPTWVTPVVIAGAIVGMTYRVVAELLDGVAGILACLLLVGDGSFRVFSTVVMAQLPAALLGLLMIWAWLRWRRERSHTWAAAFGFIAGWAAITRPVDALVYAIPIAVAMAWDLRKQRAKTWLTTAGVVVAASIPLFALQIAFDVGVTGRPFQTPYVAYLEQNQPGSAFGSRVDSSHASATRPASALPQKQIYYQELFETERGLRATGFVRWFVERLAMSVWLTLPSSSLLILIPLIVLRPRVGPIGVLLVVPALFLAMYALNPFFLGHYALAIEPCIACWVVVAASALSGSSRGPGPVLTVGIAAICLAALPEINPGIADGSQMMPVIATAEQKLATIDDAPAVVLFRFHSGSSVHEEPVYNSTVAWPDDAKIVRAHDLGPERDREIFDYYGSGAHGLPRTFYLFDRGDGSFVRLGKREEAPQRLAQYDAETRERRKSHH